MSNTLSIGMAASPKKSIKSTPTCNLFSWEIIGIATKFGDLSTFGLLFDQIGEQILALATCRLATFLLLFYMHRTKNRLRTSLEPALISKNVIVKKLLKTISELN